MKIMDTRADPGVELQLRASRQMQQQLQPFLESENFRPSRPLAECNSMLPGYLAVNADWEIPTLGV